MRYAKIDQHGWVLGIGTFSVVTPDLVPIQGNDLPFLPNTKVRYISGKFEVTDIPLFPPKPGYQWNPEAGVWADARTSVQLLSEIRRIRDAKIASSDWVMLPDVGMTPEKKEAWANYRQALRDITSVSDLRNIEWPIAPT